MPGTYNVNMKGAVLIILTVTSQELNRLYCWLCLHCTRV